VAGSVAPGTDRQGEIRRTTRETDIRVLLRLDGSGQAAVATGVGFLDHMLTLCAVHGLFDLEVQATGDTHIDDHHTVEDVAICLGQALRQALGDRAGLRRYGMSYVPMDEALARVCLDLSNRPFLHYGVDLPDQKVGRFDTCLAREFFHALALNAGLTLHVEVLYGINSHHMLEAAFKALGRALAAAVARDPRIQGQLSSKGLL